MIMCVKLIAGNSCHSSVNFPPFTKVSTVFVTSVFRVFPLKENLDLLNEQLTHVHWISPVLMNLRFGMLSARLRGKK